MYVTRLISTHIDYIKKKDTNRRRDENYKNETNLHISDLFPFNERLSDTIKNLKRLIDTVKISFFFPCCESFV